MSMDVSTVEHLVRGKTWEETPAGTKFRTGSRTITETDLVSFVALAGLTEPLFLDARHATKSGYSARLIPGTLTLCLAEGLVFQTNVLFGTGMAFMHSEVDVRSPVYVSDTIEVIVEITQSRGSTRAGAGVVTARNTVVNQNGEIVLVYTPVRLIRGKDFIASDS